MGTCLEETSYQGRQVNNGQNCKAADVRPGQVKTAHRLLGIHEFIYGQFVLNEFRKTLIGSGLKNTIRSYEYTSLSNYFNEKKFTFVKRFGDSFLKG